MEYVVIEWRGDGYWLDPGPYLSALQTLEHDLPPGAHNYAVTPEHYDFASDRCVKDLWFRSMTLDDASRTCSLVFAPNGSKHMVGLRLDYSSVTSVEVDRERDPGVGWLGSVLLDELLPQGDGVAHEIALTGGTVRVSAADVAGLWA